MVSLKGYSSEIILPVVQDIIYWIEDNLSKDLSVNVISKKSGYSHWYFQRQFAIATGFTLANYINCRKMTIAADMLKNSNCSISQISLELGFKGQATFCRIFRRQFSMSPTFYRKNEIILRDKMQKRITINVKVDKKSH